MTEDEFYVALEQKTRETGTVWTFQRRSDDLLIRAWVGADHRHCPLSFVAGTAPCDELAACARLGMSEDVAWCIASAADSQHNRHRYLYRQSLLKACGLDG